MDRYWTWCGKYAGVRQKDYLVACDGQIQGPFWGKELYNQDGEYIGELGRNNRLIKNNTKVGQRRVLFSRAIRGTITAAYPDCAPYPLLYGFDDFL